MIKAVGVREKTQWTIASRSAVVRDDKVGVEEDCEANELVDAVTILEIEVFHLSFLSISCVLCLFHGTIRNPMTFFLAIVTLINERHGLKE